MNSDHDKRMAVFLSAGLYVVTSEVLSEGRTTPEVIESCLQHGVKLFQLREKDLQPAAYRDLALRCLELTKPAGAVLLLNDHLDIAVETGADGCHLGQSDMPLNEARRMAPDLIIGASTHTEEEIEQAVSGAASYINIGPIFPTKTKQWDEAFLGLEGLRRLAPLAPIPFTVMGGIKASHISDLASCAARTMAVVTAVTAAENPGLAARDLMNQILAARDG